MWSVIVPAAGTNYIPNPSAEYNSTGWAGTGNGTIARVAGTSAYGAWSVAGTFNANSGGVTVGTANLPAAGSYTYSAWIYGGSGSQYNFGVKGTGAGAAFVGSQTITTGGTWHRYSGIVGEASAIRRFVSLVRSGAGNAPVFIDGVMIESGTNLTTYIDGDQPGGIWLGTAHGAVSQRSPDERRGGTVMALNDIGLTVLEHDGIGMAPVEVIGQPYGVLDGMYYQRTRANPRPFVLTNLFSGTTYQGLHALRNRLVNVIKSDLTPQAQPIRFLYTGAGGTQTIDAVYDSGMEFNDRRGFAQNAAVRFVAPDPYFASLLQRGTTLAPRLNLGSVNFLAKRDGITGQWGTLGVNGTTVQQVAADPSIFSIAYQNGSVWIGGGFGSVGGTAFGSYSSGNLAYYEPFTNTFGTPNGTIGYGAVYKIAPQNGTLFIGGQFDTPGGTRSQHVVRYANGAYGTFIGGTLAPNVAGAGVVYDFAFTPDGTVFVAGVFGTAGGTRAIDIAQWYNGSWGTLGQGTIDSGPGGVAQIQTLTYDGVGTLYAGGGFWTVNSGTSQGIAYWANGTWGTMAGGLFKQPQIEPGTYPLIRATLIGNDRRLLISGQFNVTTTSIQGTNIIAWNGNTYTTLAKGVYGNDGANRLGIYRLVYDNQSRLYAAGSLFANPKTAVNTALINSMAQWTGAAWVPVDVLVGVILPVNDIVFAPNDDMYIAGGFSGTGYAPQVASLINNGQANTYPTFTIRNPSAGTARIYQIKNYATDDAIFFNYQMTPGEIVELALTPGSVSMTSDSRGNIINAVVPGSNLATWKMKPGTNYLSFFADNDSVVADVIWQDRNWSADGTAL